MTIYHHNKFPVFFFAPCKKKKKKRRRMNAVRGDFKDNYVDKDDDDNFNEEK